MFRTRITVDRRGQEGSKNIEVKENVDMQQPEGDGDQEMADAGPLLPEAAQGNGGEEPAFRAADIELGGLLDEMDESFLAALPSNLREVHNRHPHYQASACLHNESLAQSEIVFLGEGLF